MDPCLYKRADSIIILFCDDLRVAGLPSTVLEIKAALFKEFQITTSDGARFLGMDTHYDMEKGYLKMHMETYIGMTYDRFKDFTCHAESLSERLLDVCFGFVCVSWVLSY
jgi:hypothetical protein